MSKNPKIWWISMKIANIVREILHNFWTTWIISMKFSGKMCLMIILKVTKSEGFTHSSEDTFFAKPQEGKGGLVKLTSPSCPAVLRLKFLSLGSAVLWRTFAASSTIFVAVWNCSSTSFFSIFVRYISCKWQKSMSFDVLCCSWFYRITYHFYLLINNAKLTSFSISNGLSFWFGNIKIISSNSVKFSKTPNCLAPHLTDKHKIYWM